MKKLTFFLLIVTLVSCRCLPQIPIQIIYAGENCEALLPNYLQWISVRDNCEDYTLTQFPLPGTILSATNPYQEVVITAKDISGNIDIEKFDVILMDTVPPEIIIDSIGFAYTDAQRKALLDAYQVSLYEFVPDSVLSTHNLAVISSPDLQHWGTYWPIDLEWCLCDSLQFNIQP